MNSCCPIGLSYSASLAMPKCKSEAPHLVRERALLGPFPSERAVAGVLEPRDYLTNDASAAVPDICRCRCCQRPLMTPRQWICCGAIVCATHAAEREGGACPACAAEAVAATATSGAVDAPNEVHEALAALEVRCPRVRFGCEWRGASRALAEHFAGPTCGGRHKEGTSRTRKGLSQVLTPLELFCTVRDGRLDDAVALLDSGRASATAADAHGVTPLLVACAADRAEVVEELLLRGADANAGDRYRRWPLSEAMSVKVMRLLLLARARSPTTVDMSGDMSSALYSAAEAGQLELVRLLLKAGAEPTDAMLPALRADQEEVFRLLVAAPGADVNRRFEEGTILDMLLQEDDLPALRLLFASPKKPSLESPEEGSCLVAADSREAAELLLEAGANLHHRDATGKTPLHYEDTRVAVLQLLIERGALVTATDNDGATPLHRAYSADEVNLFLKHGASVHSADRYGRTPLFYASTTSATQALLTAGADVDALDAEGNTPLMYALGKQRWDGHDWRERVELLLAHLKPAAGLTAALRLAVRRGSRSIVERLLALGANAAEREPMTGRTLLMMIESPEPVLAAPLIQAGADVSAVDHDNRTALWHAARGGRREAAAYLLEREASALAVRDFVDGWTPIHCAAAVAADASLLRLLLSNASPAALNARDKAGRTALCLAAEHRKCDAVVALLDAGAETDHARTTDGRTALMVICASLPPITLSDGVLARLCANRSLAHTDHDRRTPLSIAAATGNEWLVRRILARPNEHPGSVMEQACQNAASQHFEALSSEDALGYTPLLHAARGGHGGCVRALLAGGALVLHKARDGDTALLIAARHGHVDVVEALLDAGAPLGDGKNAAARSPLIGAIVGSHVEVVRKLLGAYVDVNNAASASGWSPLSHACHAAHEDVVRMLVRAGARVNRHDSSARFSPLLLAACAGSKAIVELLLARGADASAPDAYGDTALVCACRNGQAAVAHLLLSRAGDAPQRKRALLEACANGHTEVVELLLSADGATLLHDCADPRRRTPLILAAAGGHFEVARALLKAGSGVAHKDALGWSALAHASAVGHAALVAELLNGGADVNALDVHGNSPLSLAVANLLERGNAQSDRFVVTVQCLLRSGVDVNEADCAGGPDDGGTVLHAAAYFGQVVMSELPLKHPNVNVDSTDERGLTPLMVAAKAGSVDVARLLIAAGANVNRADKSGGTPLLLASDLTVINVLLAAGADPDAADATGETPLSRAVQRRDLEALSVLLAVTRNVDPINRNNAETPLEIAMQLNGYEDYETLHLDYLEWDARQEAIVLALLQAGADPRRPGVKCNENPSPQHIVAAIEAATAERNRLEVSDRPRRGAHRGDSAAPGAQHLCPPAEYHHHSA